jgi:uncharacterized protein
LGYRLTRKSGAVAVGVAYSHGLEALLETAGLDFLEVPFELLDSDAKVYPRIADRPLVLHCASLSLAGDVPPSRRTMRRVQHWASLTKTPWIGEHLATIAVAAQRDAARRERPPAYELGFTLSPPMNEDVVRQVCANLRARSRSYAIPLLIENSPLYFELPGSTMPQTEFIRRICSGSDAGLLLDLTHLYISSRNIGFDPFAALRELPLERVVEIHLSGVSVEGGVHWDCHAAPIPEVVLDLLHVAARAPGLRAVTLEYNWRAAYSVAELGSQVSRVRTRLG